MIHPKEPQREDALMPDTPRPTLWTLSEQLRERVAAELAQMEAYQLEAIGGQLRRLSEQCSGELHRRRDATARLRRPT
jgi:hypothetical protein